MVRRGLFAAIGLPWLLRPSDAPSVVGRSVALDGQRAAMLGVAQASKVALDAGSTVVRVSFDTTEIAGIIGAEIAKHSAGTASDETDRLAPAGWDTLENVR